MRQKISSAFLSLSKLSEKLDQIRHKQPKGRPVDEDSTRKTPKLYKDQVKLFRQLSVELTTESKVSVENQKVAELEGFAPSYAQFIPSSGGHTLSQDALSAIKKASSKN